MKVWLVWFQWFDGIHREFQCATRGLGFVSGPVAFDDGHVEKRPYAEPTSVAICHFRRQGERQRTQQSGEHTFIHA